MLSLKFRASQPPLTRHFTSTVCTARKFAPTGKYLLQISDWAFSRPSAVSYVGQKDLNLPIYICSAKSHGPQCQSTRSIASASKWLKIGHEKRNLIMQSEQMWGKVQCGLENEFEPAHFKREFRIGYKLRIRIRPWFSLPCGLCEENNSFYFNVKYIFCIPIWKRYEMFQYETLGLWAFQYEIVYDWI